MLTQEQIKERVNYIGASDAAAVMGMSRYKTPIQLWSEKTGLLEAEDISQKFQVRFGNKAEDIVAEFFEEESGLKVSKVAETAYHPKHKFIAANIDRWIKSEGTFVELKTASARKKAEWENDDLPAEYLIQCQHTMLVKNLSYCYIAVVFGNEEFYSKRIERDDYFIAVLLKNEITFWNDYVLKKVMPKLIQSADTDTLNRLYPHQVPGSERQLNDEAAKIAQARQALLQDKKMITDQLDQMDAQLKAMMGEYETGIAGQYKITYKAWEKKAYEVKASSGRSLRVTEVKNGNN